MLLVIAKLRREGAVSASDPLMDQAALERLAHHDQHIEKAIQRNARWCKDRDTRALRLGGQSVWLDTAALPNEAHALVTREGMKSVDSALAAQVHVWDCASQAPSFDHSTSMLWPVVIAGKLVLDWHWLKTSGKQGTAIQYKAAMATERKVHITPAFMRAHEGIAYCVLRLCKDRCPASRWTFVADLHAFLAIVQKAHAQSKPTSVMTFALADEQSGPLAAVKLFITPGSLNLLLRVDETMSTAGWQGPSHSTR